jgi:hypothetical protein
MKFTRTVGMAGILLLAAGSVAGSAQMAGHQSKKETKGGDGWLLICQKVGAEPAAVNPNRKSKFESSGKRLATPSPRCYIALRYSVPSDISE